MLSLSAECLLIVNPDIRIATMINIKCLNYAMALMFLALLFCLKTPIFAQEMTVGYLCEVGQTFYNMGRFEDALSEFRKVILADPENQDAKDYINKIFAQDLNSSSETATNATPGVLKTDNPPEQKNFMTKDQAMNEAMSKFKRRQPIDTSPERRWFTEWPAQIRPGIWGTKGKTSYYLDYFMPLAGSKQDLFFLNVRTTLSDVHTDEENAGLGLRKLLFDEKLIAGGNFYYDTRYSQNGFRHNQLGFGIETLSLWVDGRLNFYLPISKKKHIRDTYSFGERSLLQYGEYEEPLRGFDYEGGVLIPLLSDYIETRAYVGGYDYFPKLSKDINGIKGRIEVKPVSALTVEVEIKHDDVFGTDTFVGGHVSLPFEIGNIFQKKNPFEDWKEAIRFGQGPRKLKERMTDMVKRDIDITTIESKEEPPTKLHDVIFVDNSNDSDTNENGSKNHPYNTLEEAFNGAFYGQGVWIYVKRGDGTAIGYTGNYVLADHVVLWGEGYRYLGLGGSGYPVIDGGGAGNVITLANNNTVMGCEIQNGGNSGIEGNSVTDAFILNNILHDNDHLGIAFVSFGAGTFTATIKDNIAYSNGSGGAGDAYGILLIPYEGTTLIVDVENNRCYDHTEGGNNIGMYIGCRATSQIYVTLRNNNFHDNSDNGLQFEMWAGGAGGLIDATLEGNTIIDNGTSGIALDHTDHGSNTILRMSNNVIANNGNYGIYLWLRYADSDTTLDMGGGAFGARGYNSVYGHAINEIFNDTHTEVKAENNWWGQDPPVAGQFGGAQTTDYTPWLTSNPN